MAESTEMDYKSLPKIELHAHLNGSLSTSCLTELYHMKYPNTDDPPSHINGYKILDKFVELKDCFERFKYAHDLTDTPKRLKRATEIIINECHDDGVVYLEIRTTPRATEHMTKEVYLSTICEAIIECHEKEPKNPIVKLIPSFDRSKGVNDARDTLDVVLKVREKFPGMIVGIDLSGNPENTNFQDFKPLLQEARNAGLKLTLHCAETAGTEEENMEMLEFGMDRMGHGTFMDESPDTWLTLREKKIPVECCITSNLKCATVPDITKHHIQKLLH
uniref:Adenosine deaminase domain-containing protein n=2 Tax=Lutzomyia longipalpis TaxID=7200 RepID=A0A1B0CP12_LUTLO